MKIIACVDNSMGMAFGGRRQSRDRLLCEDIINCAGAKLCIDPYSELLFPDCTGVKSVDLRTYKPCDDEYVFTETTAPSQLDGDISEIILYRWNRDYPANLYFDIELTGRKLIETFEFEGSSHDKITRERYVK